MESQPNIPSPPQRLTKEDKIKLFFPKDTEYHGNFYFKKNEDKVKNVVEMFNDHVFPTNSQHSIFFDEEKINRIRDIRAKITSQNAEIFKDLKHIEGEFYQILENAYDLENVEKTSMKSYNKAMENKFEKYTKSDTDQEFLKGSPRKKLRKETSKVGNIQI